MTPKHEWRGTDAGRPGPRPCRMGFGSGPCGLEWDDPIHHAKHSTNGCVFCPRLWSAHTPAERDEPEAPPIEDQPPPIPNDEPAVWALVIRDMQDRDHVGRQRYGTPLQAGNGRDALINLYQELLDAVVYCRQMIRERELRG